jgi:hypothetical protein
MRRQPVAILSSETLAHVKSLQAACEAARKPDSTTAAEVGRRCNEWCSFYRGLIISNEKNINALEQMKNNLTAPSASLAKLLQEKIHLCLAQQREKTAPEKTSPTIRRLPPVYSLFPESM